MSKGLLGTFMEFLEVEIILVSGNARHVRLIAGLLFKD